MIASHLQWHPLGAVLAEKNKMKSGKPLQNQ
jgi:hypothetical protein